MTGEGPDVVLIHGAFGSLRDFTFDLSDRLSERYRVIAFDRPGLGYTDRTDQAYASAFVLVTGLVFLAAGLAKLGFITQFLSKPVMDGFVTGLAIFVAVGQLNKLFGVPKPEGNTVEKLLRLYKQKKTAPERAAAW